MRDAWGIVVLLEGREIGGADEGIVAVVAKNPIACVCSVRRTQYWWLIKAF
jgi:hypothetical protein